MNIDPIATPTPSAFDRRSLLVGATVLLAMPALRRARAADKLPELVLHGPPAGPSVVLAHALASGALAELAEKPSVRIWKTPDELRAGISSGTMQAAVMPTTTAANLYNRGLGVRLLNTMTDGLLYVLATDPRISGFTDLRGRRLVVPFGNSLPNFVLSAILSHHAIDEAGGIDIQITGTPIEAIQMLLTGRADAAMVPEPAGSLATLKARQMFGKDIFRIADIQEEWGRITGLGPQLPQAGLALTDKVRAEQPHIADALQAALERAADEVRADPQKAAGEAAELLDLPPAAIAASVPVSKLTCRRARDIRPALDAMYQVVMEGDAKGIGGKIPDDGFYL